MEGYLKESKEEMDTLEMTKVYMSCIKNHLLLSDGFKAEMTDLIINKKLPNCDAASLPYILPLL